MSKKKDKMNSRLLWYSLVTKKSIVLIISPDIIHKSCNSTQDTMKHGHFAACMDSWVGRSSRDVRHVQQGVPSTALIE